MKLIFNDIVNRFWLTFYSTGCPPNHVTLFDLQFLELEAITEHFFTAQSV